MMRRSLLSAGAVLLAPFLFAGEPAVAPVATQPPEPPRAVLGVTGTYLFDTDFDRSIASVRVARVGFDAGFRFDLSGPWKLQLDFYGDYSSYRVSNFQALVPGVTRSPISDGILLHIQPLLGYEIRPGWRLLAGPTVEIAGDERASVGDAIRYGGVFAVEHAFAKFGELTLGISILTRQERSTQILPYFRFRPYFRLFPNVEFESRPRGLTIYYHLTPQFAVFAQGEYDSREYRLKRGASISSGIWRESAIPLSAGVSFRPSRNVSINAYAGISVFRTVRLDDRVGHTLFDRDVAPTPFIGISTQLKF